MRSKRFLRSAIVVVVLLCTEAASALATGPFAPVHRRGPALDVPRSTLAQSLRCTAAVSLRKREPILLVPGTTLTPHANFSWNYERALAERAMPYCTVELPQNANGDIQIAAEFVVYAIRTAHRLSGHRVQILGYSQGGMVPRWALRFWPDTRRLVDDDVGIDASNHGTLDAEYCSVTSSCPAAFWQQRSDAQFIDALNSFQETFSGISYTEIYSNTDEVVTPNLGPAASSRVTGGGGRTSNVAVQTICPADVSDHLAMGTYDPVAYALAIDAFTHRGPADPARVPRSVCLMPFQPGIDAATFPTDYAAYIAFIARSIAAAKQVPAEPPLRCYVLASGCS